MADSAYQALTQRVEAIDQRLIVIERDFSGAPEMLVELREYIDHGLNTLRTTLLREIRAEMHAGFRAVDTRFKRMDTRFDRLETRFDRLETRLGRLETRFDRLDRKIDQFIDTQRQFNRSVDHWLRALERPPRRRKT